MVETSDGNQFEGPFEALLQKFAQNGGDLIPYLLLVMEHVPALMTAVDKNGGILFASQHHSLLAGVDDDVSAITDCLALFPLQVHERVEALIKPGGSSERKPWEINVKHKDGSNHVYLMQSFVLSSGNTGDICFTLGIDKTNHDLMEQALRDHKSQIAYITFHDPLTGLANRSLFYDRMEKSLSRAKRSASNLALMLIDLDRFKVINDSLGRDAGDLFLKAVAEQLKSLLRDTDTVARLSGDEFVVVLENVTKAEDIENIASKILQVLAEPVDINGTEITCTASIGISLFPKDGDSTDKLLRHADLAMYRAKTAGKNRLQFYLKAMTDTAVNYLLLENDLRKAIENKDLVLFYQPQIDLQSAKVVGLEALVRWQHPEKGLVPPVEFIPLAEETGLIEPIGEWVLNHACERFKHWLDSGLNLGKIAVNLSARQFRQDNFDKIVQRALEASGLSAEYLELEITETSVMENAANTINMLNELNDMGLSLAIDDFGTGYSSLSYLKKFPIQKLKVDRSFIKDIDSNENDAAIAKSIIDLGHNMSLEVIAEGVERESQKEWLTAKGCDQVQGYFYSKPLSEEDLMKLVYDEKKVCNQNYCVLLHFD